ncbi:unnamed protein product [Candidula unifasciata]|uniref:C-type lectin domain-containing protein n=1 Tax=Candidula unifasciata TaxID=100452 RepID=A0A8S3ZFF6_9EUPU|nr:unnamed protein product [Candidula unifasciata]
MAAGIIAVSLLAVLLQFSQTDAQACKEGWEHFNGNCYGYGDTPVSWTEAATICSVIGATLAEVDSEEENEFLVGLFDNVTSSTRVWLGGTDILNEGNWVWVSNRRHIFPFQNWHSNQPSDSNSAGEDCLTMYSSYKFQWDDAQCDKVNTFICEKKSEEDSGVIVG